MRVGQELATKLINTRLAQGWCIRSDETREQAVQILAMSTAPFNPPSLELILEVAEGNEHAST